MTSKLTDQHYQRLEQYRDASPLGVRARLHQRYRTNRYPWQRWLWDQFDLPPAGRVLDIRCVPGGLWSQNLE